MNPVEKTVGVPTGTLTVFPGCAGLLIGFAARLLDEEIAR
jgi:hypothetical protein